MSYDPEKTLGDEYEDDRSSAEINTLLRKVTGEEHQATASKRKRCRAVPLFFHVGLVITYTCIFVLVLWSWRRDRSTCRKSDSIDSSAASALEYGTRVFDEIDDLHIYFGKPSPKLDAKWRELLQYQWLQVPEADMQKLGRIEEGIKLPDGGYFGTLAVYHDLHCLRRIHHTFYRDHYFPDLNPMEIELDSLHAAHCLDSLRQSIQCAGDVSMLTMRWGVDTREPIANFTGRHECVNWDRIDDWARDHVYDVMAPGVLVHPVLGPSYPDGKPGLGVGTES